MLSRIKEILHDRLFVIPVFLFILIAFLNTVYGGNQTTGQNESKSFPWNTQVLMESGKPAYVSKNFINESDIRYGQKVRGICLQDDQVLFIFDDDLDGGAQLLVYNVFGEYLYGYRMYIGGRSTMRVALSPTYEGILMFDYKDREENRYPIIHLTPDGHYEEKWFAYSDDLGFGSEAYIDGFSDYEFLDENGKCVIRNKTTLDITNVFDFSEGTDN